MQKDFRPNNLKKTWLKLTDKQAYKKYKQYYSHHKLTAKLQGFVDAGLDTTIGEILVRTESSLEINVLHNGNAGDIIYSLPIIKKLNEITAKPVNLVLNINQPLTIGNGYEHPLGNVMLDQPTVGRLVPLMAAQDYVNKVEIFQDHRIDLDLTLFRNAGFAMDKGNIALWNSFTSGITANFAEAWLKVNPKTTFSGNIVLARSSRYNNALVDYSFLSEYKEVVFVGVKSEFDEMKKKVQDLQWQQVTNFLEMAEIIAGCKLFIGNQSFPYSVAEGLKVKRLLEVFYQIPNVMPEGKNGYPFCFQKHFEWLVNNLYHD